MYGAYFTLLGGRLAKGGVGWCGEGEEFKQGINASKYKALAKVSKPTATRDLADLLKRECIKKLPGGERSTRYVIALGE